MGIPAEKSTRVARIRAHNAFDEMWKDQKNGMSRRNAYQWLARELDIPMNKCHIGIFDEETCERVIQLCKERGRNDS